MQGTVTSQNDVKSSPSTSHEPSRLVTLNREWSLFSPGWGKGGSLVLSRLNLPDFPSRALYYSYDSPPWRLINNQFSKVPVYTLLATTDLPPFPWFINEFSVVHYKAVIQ